MLGDRDALATIAVKDLDAARSFYGDKLGLTEVATPEPSVLSFKSGASKLVVYQSQFAGTNQATAVTWLVGSEHEEIVRALKARGVAFEHYEMPNIHLEGDVHVAGRLRVVWCKDPDGNIISIANGDG